MFADAVFAKPTLRKADWVFLVELNGIRNVMKSPGLHDEPLQGKRWGQRSVRLNKGYRLIYRLTGETVIELLEVHKHEY